MTSQLKLPAPSVVRYVLVVPPPIFTLPTGPKLDTPDTVKPVNVPKLVIFGCALLPIVNVPLILPVSIASANKYPEMFASPATMILEPVTVTTLALPAILTVTLLLLLTVTLLVPLAISDVPDD